MKAIRNGGRRPRAVVARKGAAAAKVTKINKPGRARKVKRTTAKATATSEKLLLKVEEAASTASSETATSLDDINSAAHQDAMQELEDRVNNAQDSWETESLLGDLIDELTDPKGVLDDPEMCTPDEAALLRNQLRLLGPIEFCHRTVESGHYTTRKLLSAFGVRVPPFLEGQPDDALDSLLSLAFTRELAKRAKLSRFNTVTDAVELIAGSRNIICLTGAGISTSLGIPDFRSKGTGLYSKLEHLGLSDPQEVFDIDQFHADPTIFYSVARDILPETDRYTPTHRFIAMLQERGKLLTNYSQNIDNLEAKAGIQPDKLVQCHGSFATATCIRCDHRVVGDTIFPTIKAGKIPKCGRCLEGMMQSTSSSANGNGGGGGQKKGAQRRRRRRLYGADPDEDSDSDGSRYDLPHQGVMKPDITFFGEALPDDFAKRLTEQDRHLVDLVIVIGTSLKVTPVSEIVSYLPPQVPQIYISRTPVGHINFDIDLLGDCDVVVAELCRRLGWDMNHEMVPGGQRVSVKSEDGFASRHVFTEL